MWGPSSRPNVAQNQKSQMDTMSALQRNYQPSTLGLPTKNVRPLLCDGSLSSRMPQDYMVGALPGKRSILLPNAFPMQRTGAHYGTYLGKDRSKSSHSWDTVPITSALFNSYAHWTSHQTPVTVCSHPPGHGNQHECYSHEQKTDQHELHHRISGLCVPTKIRGGDTR